MGPGSSRAPGALVSFAIVSFAIASLSGVARGQCTQQFVPGDGAPGANGRVVASTTWDPDGAGPAAPRLVIAGAFTVAGDVAARGIASHDPASGDWAAFGPGLDGEVVAVAVDASGQLIAAVNPGLPSSAGRVVAWNGSAWVQLGATFDHRVYCLLAHPNGDLWVGGEFTNVGTTPALHIARWDGTAWSAFVAIDGPVRAMIRMPNGDAVVGGTFSWVDAVQAGCVARWDGVAWSPLGSGIGAVGINGPYAFAVAGNGDLIAGGFFLQAGGANASNVARWNGTTWSGFGSGVANNPQFTVPVRTVAVLPGGDVVAGGQFTSAGGVQARSIARWNGTAWSAMGPGFAPLSVLTPSTVWTLAPMANGDLVAGGGFTSANGQVGDNLSRWDGTAWRSLAPGFNGSVRAIAEGPSGELVVGGTFGVAGGVAASRVARWNGSAWSPLGSGVDNTVFAAIVLANGDVVVGGSFTIAGGVVCNRVARWNGAAWAPMGTGMNGAVVALGLLPSGELVAAGGFTTADGLPAARVARWTGTGWVELGGGIGGGSNPTVTAMHVQPDGTLIVGGRFATAGTVAVNNMAAWNGTTWSALGTAPLTPSAITTALGGTLLACDTTWISQWTGGTWTNVGMGASSYIGITGLPDGDLIAVGSFEIVAPPFVTTRGIARWRNGGWTAVDGGLDDGLARVVRVLKNGDVVIGGEFQSAGGEPSPWFARLEPTCRADATALGAGCTSSGGANVLTVRELPWLGGTMRVRSTGVPAVALVVAVTGFAPAALPLASVFATAGAGCDLHVSPDLLDVVLASGNAANVALTIPATAALVGQSFHHQHVPIELDGTGAFVSVTATNALTLTIGSL